MRKTMHDYELKYSYREKKELSLVKAVPHFMTYILSSHVIAYVASSPIRMFLNQHLREGKWANWLAKIQECDIEIKPLHAIKGHGICKLIARNNSLDGCVSITIGGSTSNSHWYKDIIFLFKIKAISKWNVIKRKENSQMKSTQYVLIVEILFRRNFDGMLLRCVDEIKDQELIK
jgi:hypothetical protein